MTTIPHIQNKIPPHTLPILITFALWDAPLLAHRLLDLLNSPLSSSLHTLHDEKKYTAATLKPVLSELSSLGFIHSAHAANYQISAEVGHAILLDLHNSKKLSDWIEFIQHFLNQNKEYAAWANPSSEFCQREMLFAAATDDAAELGKWRSQFFAFGNAFEDLLACKLFSTPAGTVLFSQFAPHIQSMLLFDLFSAASWSLQECNHAYQYALSQVGTFFKKDTMLMDVICIQAILRGESESGMQELLAHMGHESYPAAIVQLLRGDFYTSTQIFNNVQVQTHSQQKLFVPDIAGLFYTVAQLAQSTPTHLKLAKEQCDNGIKLKQAQFYSAISPFIEHLINDTPARPSLQNISQQNLDALFVQLSNFWQNNSPVESNRLHLYLLISQCEQNGYQWVAAEIDQLRHQQFNEKCELGDWHRDRQLQPLCNIMKREDAWQRALLALTQLKPPTQSNQDTRIAWFVECEPHYINLEPREQKRNAKGVWSKGRPVALKRLSYEQDSLPGISDQDKKIAGCIRKSYDNYYGGSDYELNAEKALPFLIGHPAVFWFSASETQIEVIKGEPALVMKQEGDTISMYLDPNMQAENTTIWRKQTPTRLAVYPSSAEIKQIASIIGKGLTVPISAKTQLIKVIASIAPHLAIHSDLPELAKHMDSIAADTTIYAHLLPFKEGLRIQFLMRPLPDGGWFPPGKGPLNVVGEHQGKAIQTSRHFENELSEFNSIIKNCPTLSEAEQVGQEWEFNHPASCLELLSELNQINSQVNSQLHSATPNKLKLVWPEGVRFRIKSSRSLSHLHLSIKKQGDWFTAGGELKLDDGKVIALRELIRLTDKAVGRFLPLDEHHFLELTENFKKRLQELQALSEADGKDGVRVSQLAAPLLAELANEAHDVKADAAWKAQVKKLNALADYDPQIPSTLQASLRDYQRDGYQWMARLAHWGVGACLADDMGLGKTVQTLAILVERAPNGPALVVAPISVAMNWQSEVAKFAPTLRVRTYHQQRSLKKLGPFDLVIASYGMLQQDADAFAEPDWHTVVLDEAQSIKNSATKRSQAAMRLKADFRVIASGTPVENHLSELWNLFHFINPGLLGSKEHFAERFTAPIERGDKQARANLKRLIQPFILRRTKTQVLSELPARTEITWQVEFSDQERDMYEALRKAALEKIAQIKSTDSKSIQILAELTKLRRFCCHPKLAVKNSTLAGSKLAAFAEIVEELLDNNHKALVFSQFVDHLTIVRNWLDEKNIRYQYLDGSTPANERKKRVDAFQAGQGDIFLISLKAGGTGLNLTAADYVIHLDPWWNPAVEDQASDRAHRMGQLRPVTIYRLVAKQTIEDQIIALHAQKRELADSLLEGGDASAKLDSAALLRLLKGEE